MMLIVRRTIIFPFFLLDDQTAETIAIAQHASGSDPTIDPDI